MRGLNIGKARRHDLGQGVMPDRLHNVVEATEQEGVEPMTGPAFYRRMGPLMDKTRVNNRAYYANVAFARKLEVAVDNTQRHAAS